MDESSLLLFLNTVDPAVASAIYQLAEDWPDKTLEPQLLNQLSAQILDRLNIEK